MNLRPYQLQAESLVFEQFKEVSSTLLVMATGLGKTVTFASIAAKMGGGRVMVIAHREELIRQAADKISRISGENVGIEMADSRADSGALFNRPRIVVASVQTLISSESRRLEKFDPHTFSLVIIDEAHHATADSYMRVVKHFQQNTNVKILGVTATPDRTDEQALAKVFESVAMEYDIKHAIEDGYLVDVNVECVEITGLDYSKCRTTAGELNAKDVANAQNSDSVLQGMADGIMQRVGRRKTVVFAAPGFKGEGDDEYRVSERLASLLNVDVPGSAHRISQDTPKHLRRELIQAFAAGEFPYLVNVGVLTEGFDDPSIECVAVCRPTTSRSLYAQMIGRGTRPLPGVIENLDTADARRWAIKSSAKPALTVIDMVGNSGKHKLVGPSDVLGSSYSDEVVERAKATIREKGEGNPIEEMEKVARIIKEEANLKLARANLAVRMVNPFDALDVPVIAKQIIERDPTPSQFKMIVEAGINPPKDMTSRQASAIIGKIIERRNNKLASYKQINELAKRGIDARNMTVGQAMNEIFRTKFGVNA